MKQRDIDICCRRVVNSGQVTSDDYHWLQISYISKADYDY